MKKALITGADRGLGYALCGECLANGYEVFAGQFMPEWPELGELARANPERLHLIPLDVSSDASVDAALLLVQRQTADLNALFNVAGITRVPPGAGFEFPDGQMTIFDRPNFGGITYLFNTNLYGPMRVCNRFLPLLLKGQGDKTVVNISSEAGSMTDMTVVRKVSYAYCMSKAALNMQSHLLRNTLIDAGVKVLVVHPGWLRSYMGGTLNGEATEEPAGSARGILKLVAEQRDPRGHMYYWWDGREMNY